MNCLQSISYSIKFRFNNEFYICFLHLNMIFKTNVRDEVAATSGKIGRMDLVDALK